MRPPAVPASDPHAAQDPRPLVRAGIVLGVGLGMFLDGLLFHQILQWHHLVDERTDSMGANLLADGLFHAAAWLVTLAGIALLWNAARTVRPPAGARALVGSGLLGLAAFNVAETVVDHFLLRLHWLHVSDHPLWDVGFVVLNLALGLAAWRILRSDGAVRLRRARGPQRRALGGP